MHFVYGAVTRYGSLSQTIRLYKKHHVLRSADLRKQVPQHPLCNACRLSRIIGLDCSAFARRYLRNRGYFLFVRLLRCFSSPAALYPPYVFRWEYWRITPVGYPIRKSGDQSLIAAPPGVSPLTASFIGPLPQGIHRAPFVA